MKKKLVSLLLVASMMTCAACGSNDSTTASSSSSETTQSTEASTTTEAAPVEQTAEIAKPEKITVMVDGTVFTKENAREDFFNKLTELTGIEYEVIQPDHDAYFDSVSQTIASGEWPDVVILSSTYYSSYASQGVLWDMTDAWNNSDLKKRQEAHNSLSVVEGEMIDGVLYGMPATRGNGCVTYVKQTWLDEAGLTAPTTYDEYINMLEAFKQNGHETSVAAAGFVGTEAPYTNYLPEFYQDAYPGFYKNADGVYVDGFTLDSMKDAMQRLQDAVAAGYLDKTTLDIGTKDVRNKFYADDTGVFTYWAGTWATNLKTNLESNGLSGDLVAIAPIKEVGTYFDRISPVWAITTKCENPEGVFKYFIEAMQDGGDVQFLWTYGVEGKHWSTAAETVLAGTDKEKTYEAGQFHMLENLEKAGTLYTKAHIDPKLALVELANDPSAVPEEAAKSSDIFNSNCVSAQLIPSTDAMTEYNGDLTTLKNELIAKVALGELSVEEAYARFENEGGAKWSQEIVDSLNK